LSGASGGRNDRAKMAIDARPGGPTAKRQPSPEGLGNRYRRGSERRRRGTQLIVRSPCVIRSVRQQPVKQKQPDFVPPHSPQSNQQVTSSKANCSANLDTLGAQAVNSGSPHPFVRVHLISSVRKEQNGGHFEEGIAVARQQTPVYYAAKRLSLSSPRTRKKTKTLFQHSIERRHLSSLAHQ
jgi:hypothetical protein